LAQTRRLRNHEAMPLASARGFLLGLTAAATFASSAAGAPLTSTARPVLTQVAAQLVADGAPGALAVVRTPAGMRGAARGLGSREHKLQLRVGDRFRIASITKTFVATLVLQLVAEGKLGLDDPVESRLPGVVPNGGAITLRELLNHTSGLFDYTEDPGFDGAVTSDPGRTWTPQELLAYSTQHAPLFAPGSGWSYSNTDYIVLGLVVEAAAGETLARQLSTRFFQPLRLASTSLPSDAAIEGRHAHGYIGSATVPLPPGTLLDLAGLSPSELWAAGGGVSNAADVTRFYAQLLGGRLLPPELLSAMRTLAPRSNFGLGLEQVITRCGQAFGHEGDFPGYRSIVYARRDGRRVALVMVNIDATHVPWDELRTAAARAFCSG
jgi:D-alanyl-D-alanine carboxypeptidase